MDAHVSYDGGQNGKEKECSGAGPSSDAQQETIATAAEGNSGDGRQGPLGHIYFIETEDGQFVKIGYSKQVLVRLSELGTLRPSSFSLRVIGSIPGTRVVERWLHNQFAEERDKGEWFRKTPRVTAFIRLLALTPPVIIKRRSYRRKALKQEPFLIEPEIEMETSQGKTTTVGFPDDDESTEEYIQRRLKEEFEKLKRQSPSKPKPPTTPEAPRDSCESNDKHLAAVALGKRRMALLTPEERQALSSKAGKRRLKTISKARRREIAKKASAARWGKNGK